MRKLKPMNKKPLKSYRDKGLKLWQCDPKTGDVYNIPIVTKENAHEILTKPREIVGDGNLMAVVNPKHLIVWALNAKTAVKKFQKQLGMSKSVRDSIDALPQTLEKAI